MERYYEYLEQNATTNMPMLKRCFEKMNKELQKGASELSKDEVLAYFKDIVQSPSIEFLQVTRNQLRRYVDWLSQYEDVENVYESIELEELKECLYKLDDRIITRNELLRQMESLLNESDKFFCLALFEGIRGHAYRDMHYISKKDIDINNNTITLKSGETRKVSEELIEIGIKAINSHEYNCYSKTLVRPYKDPTSEYVFKALNNSIANDGEEVPETTLLSKYKQISMRIRNELGNEDAFKPKALRDSGMVHMINKLYKSDKRKYKDATIKNTILTHKTEIENVYGIVHSAESFVLKYEEFFEV